jgi:hypothetical protein
MAAFLPVRTRFGARFVRPGFSGLMLAGIPA